MQNLLLSAIYLQIPVVIAGSLHMVFVSLDIMPQLKQPIHRDLFGENKTWRGAIVMPLMSVIAVWMMQTVEKFFDLQGLVRFSMFSALEVGTMLGLGYIVFELPNSFIKRRLGIPPGEVPDNNKYLFIAMDQVDSGIGIALVGYFICGRNLAILLAIIFTFPLIALLTKRILFIFKLKKNYT